MWNVVYVLFGLSTAFAANLVSHLVTRHKWKWHREQAWAIWLFAMIVMIAYAAIHQAKYHW